MRPSPDSDRVDQTASRQQERAASSASFANAAGDRDQATHLSRKSHLRARPRPRARNQQAPAHFSCPHPVQVGAYGFFRPSFIARVIGTYFFFRAPPLREFVGFAASGCQSGVECRSINTRQSPAITCRLNSLNRFKVRASDETR